MNLHRDILRLAVPSILANITVPLVGMVDIAVAGHLGASGGLGAAALIGGISIGTMLFDMLYWNFGFLRGGTGGLAAQAYGRLRGLCPLLSPAAFGRAPDGAWITHRTEAIETACRDITVILKRALGIAFGSGLALIALQWVVVQVAFLLVECSPEVQTLATQYFYIRIWAAPATLSLFAFKGWFIGMQDTVRPMICDLLVNATNIVLSIGLAFGYAGLPELGFAGVAWGTLIAQWTGFLYASLAVWFRYGWVLKHAKQGGHAAGFREFFVLNRDLFFRSVCMIAVYIGFTMISARYGDMMLAVGAILMKLLMIFSYFTDGFAYAGEALTGRFIGEGSPEGVRSTIRQTFLWCLGVTALFFLVYGVGGVPLLRLMTSDPSVVDAGREFIPWLLLMPVIGCPAFTWDGIFMGATASKDLRNSTAWCVVGFFGVWFIGIGLLKAVQGTVPETLAIHLLMAAYFAHLLVRAAYLTLRWRKAIPYA
ncbi:MAG: MATE family efflux transporter [Bacteroidales bacterium]|nr:MATE family efflux transporter [Bacteroidales bacterium]